MVLATKSHSLNSDLQFTTLQSSGMRKWMRWSKVLSKCCDGDESTERFLEEKGCGEDYCSGYTWGGVLGWRSKRSWGGRSTRWIKLITNRRRKERKFKTRRYQWNRVSTSSTILSRFQFNFAYNAIRSRLSGMDRLYWLRKQFRDLPRLSDTEQEVCFGKNAFIILLYFSSILSTLLVLPSIKVTGCWRSRATESAQEMMVKSRTRWLWGKSLT